MKVSRRQFVSSIAGAGIAGMAAPNLVLAQNSGPIRIGLLAAKTGPLASGGIDMELALTMFLKERDYTLAGRKVELIAADTAGAPATARTKAQELIEKNNVHCMIGPLFWARTRLGAAMLAIPAPATLETNCRRDTFMNPPGRFSRISILRTFHWFA